MNRDLEIKKIKNYLIENNVTNLSLSNQELMLKNWFFYEIDLANNLNEIRLLINKLFIILKTNDINTSKFEVILKLFGYTNSNLIFNIYNKFKLSNYSFEVKKINEIDDVNKRKVLFNQYKIYKTTFKDRNLKNKNEKIRKKFNIKYIFFGCRLSNGEMWNYLNILEQELVKFSQILMLPKNKIWFKYNINISIETYNSKLDNKKDHLIKYFIKELLLITKYKNHKIYTNIEQNIFMNKKSENEKNNLKLELFNNINLYLKNKFKFNQLKDIFNLNELSIELNKINEYIKKENHKIESNVLLILIYTYNLLTKQELNYKKWIYLYYLDEFIQNKGSIKEINNLKVIIKSFLFFFNQKTNVKINDMYISMKEIEQEYKDWNDLYIPEIKNNFNISFLT